MIILPLQWDSHRGPDAVGQHKLTFTMDESVAQDFNVYTKKGTQFIVMMVEVDSKEANEFRDESPQETTERFRKRMNAMINTTAEDLGEDPKKYREKIKEELIADGTIQESTNELGLEGYAKVINKLLHIRK